MKRHAVSWNGERIEDAERAIPAWNRSFHFGDGLFETFRAIDRKALFLHKHLERSRKGMQRLGILPPEDWNEERIGFEIEALMEAEGVRHARVRLTVSRSGGGAYTPITNTADRLIELTGEVEDRFQLPSRGSSVEVYKGMVKHPNLLSSFKCTAAPLYVMAKQWAASQGYDEALVQGPEGRIIESASSNLFWIKGNEAITPPVEAGCVNGVMREELIKILQEEGWELREESLSVERLMEAEELVLCNAVQGIVPVRAFRDQRYFKKQAERWVRALNERNLS